MLALICIAPNFWLLFGNPLRPNFVLKPVCHLSVLENMQGQILACSVSYSIFSVLFGIEFILAYVKPEVPSFDLVFC